LQRLQEQARLLVQGRALALDEAYDAATLRAYLARLAVQVDRPPRSAVLALTATGPVVQATAQDGMRLDVARAVPLLAAALSQGQPTIIELPVVATHPAVSTASALREAARLKPLLANHVTLTAPGHTLTLTRADLARMYRPVTVRQGAQTVYADVADRTAITAYIFAHSPALDQPGRDARVLYAGGHVRVVLGRDGRVVDRGAAVAALVAALERRTNASVPLPFVNGPTVTAAEANRVAARLQRTLRTTVVWLPQRHWAIPPAAIAAALTLQRVPAVTGTRLVAHLDHAALARDLPGSAPLATTPARDAAVVKRGDRYVVIHAVAGHRPNYAALAAEMVAAPPGRAVYHLPIATITPARTTAAAEALARAHKVTG
jgi:vancomycin resistance protein YoaR